MAKAINWPEEFYQEVIAEDASNNRIALRLGTLYFDNGYFVANEIVDIRVDHKIVRKAQIIGELRVSSIKDLSDRDISQCKKRLNSRLDIIDFLAKTYDSNVDQDTVVTVISYRNLPMEVREAVDDPHL